MLCLPSLEGNHVYESSDLHVAFLFLEPRKKKILTTVATIVKQGFLIGHASADDLYHFFKLLFDPC
jgi:hypothetical protein